MTDETEKPAEKKRKKEKSYARIKEIYQDTRAIMYVVDAGNKKMFDLKVKEEVKELLNEEALKDCPMLIYSNKQDVVSELEND